MRALAHWPIKRAILISNSPIRSAEKGLIKRAGPFTGLQCTSVPTHLLRTDSQPVGEQRPRKIEIHSYPIHKSGVVSLI